MNKEAILEKMDTLVKTAETETRSMSDEEVITYEGLERDLLSAQKAEEVLKRHKAYEAPKVTILPGLPAGVKERDSYEFAFDQYLRGVKGAEGELTFAQGEATGAAGSYLVPVVTEQKLVDIQKAFGGISSIASHFSTANGQIVNYPSLDDTAGTAAIAAEGAAPGSAGSDLTFGTVTFNAWKYAASGTGQAGLAVSNELIQDAQFNITDLVTTMLGRRLARKMALDFAVGTGTTMPVGLFDKADGIRQLTSGVFTYAGLLAMVHGLDPFYRPNASWLFNDDIASRIEQLVDSQGRPLLLSYNQNVGGGPQLTGQTLLGYPVHIDQGAPAWTAAATSPPAVNTAFVAFGDFGQAYMIRDVMGSSILVDPYGLMNKASVQYFGYARADGNWQNRKAAQIYA